MCGGGFEDDDISNSSLQSFLAEGAEGGFKKKKKSCEGVSELARPRIISSFVI